MILLLLLFIFIIVFSSYFISKFKNTNVFLFFKRHNVSINQIRLLLISVLSGFVIDQLDLSIALSFGFLLLIILGFLNQIRNFFAGIYLNLKQPKSELEYQGESYFFHQLGVLKSILHSDTKNIKIGNAEILGLPQINSYEAGIQIKEEILLPKKDLDKSKEALIISWLGEINLNIEATKNSMQFEQKDDTTVIVKYIKTYFK